jgi:hypothetical protein
MVIIEASVLTLRRKVVYDALHFGKVWRGKVRNLLISAPRVFDLRSQWSGQVIVHHRN